MEFQDVLFHRRSVRDFTEQAVDKESITTLIHAATQAPSALNKQPWAFAVIQDQSLLKRYSDRSKSLLLKTLDSWSMPAELEAKLADPDFNIFYNSGTLIVIYAKPTGPHPAWDCCLAGQNLLSFAKRSDTQVG